MTRQHLSRIVAYVSCVLLLATAAFHQSGYGSVAALAAQGPPDLSVLMPLLWVAFTVALVLCAMLVFALASAITARRTVLLSIAALTPLSAAVLQVLYLGFIPPTAILLLDALMIGLAAVVGHARQPVSAPAA